MDEVQTRCGYVAIVGRPNVGKSTLLNALLEQKLSITSRKPQTTRHQLLGIKTTQGDQILYVDTPGIHVAGKRAINRYMNRNALSVIRDVDVVIFVLDRKNWNEDDQLVEDAIQGTKAHLIIAVNKVDLMKDKGSLLPLLASLQARSPKAVVMPISGEKRDNLEAVSYTHLRAHETLMNLVCRLLLEKKKFF